MISVKAYVAQNRLNCARYKQETEDLELDEQTVKAGVLAVLTDPSKGTYFLLEVLEEIRSLDLQHQLDTSMAWHHCT